MKAIAMSPSLRVFFLCIAFALISSCKALSETHPDADKKEYIVYMGELPTTELSVAAVHMSMLQSTLGSRASEALLYSYKRSFNGFVARLTEQEKNIISKMDGVVSVFPNKKKQLHTTRSWDFIGFPEKAAISTRESDIIIGMLDTGVWPESQSFSDKGYGPPPAKWKGKCQSHRNFTCNNKIVGARYYLASGEIPEGEVDSPRDMYGHGTHTASTAAGNIVRHASLYGLGEGTARGGVPSARLSIYKVCWSDGCSEADILAGFDDAIADGVDIISASFGGSFAADYFEESLAIGAFHAMKKGILTSNSAGNGGPVAQSIVNVSPWSLSVAANTIDRKFVANVHLGNGKTFQGIAINTWKSSNKDYPLVWGGNIPNSPDNSYLARYCLYSSLDAKKAKGTIVLCDTASDGTTQQVAGAVGTIMQSDAQDYTSTFPIPASTLNATYSAEVFKYINTTSKPTAAIEKSTVIGDDSAPFVVSFSSRGPNPITLDILKPDITAPGVDILAAWSGAAGVTTGDDRLVPYNIISGTSMSCPHATAAAAYVKSFHKDWSPAAIKSALMTTATVFSPKHNPEAEFAYGSGQINPIKAKDPGLIYDLGEQDYVNFLCGQVYDTSKLQILTGDKTICSDKNSAAVWDLNYPSFALSGEISGPTTRVFHRTVTNVGSGASTYKAIVSSDKKLNIQVQPEVLKFKSKGQKLTFKVTVAAEMKQEMLLGSLVWNDGVHQVRSPIVAYGYH